MFLCEGVKVLFKVALVMVGSALSDPKERDKCGTMYETLHLLRNIPPKMLEENHFLQRVIALDLSDREVEKEHLQQATRRRKEKERERLEREQTRNGNGTNNGTKNGTTSPDPRPQAQKRGKEKGDKKQVKGKSGDSQLKSNLRQ
jgi:hypothetical protein